MQQYLARSYTQVMKKTKHWWDPDNNPTRQDKYAFELLEKAEVDLFIDFMETKTVNVNVVDYSTCSLLIKAQGIPTYRNQHTKTLTKQELQCRAIKAVVYLVRSRKVNINYRDKKGVTALLSASHWGYYRITEVLLSLGADPNISSDFENFQTTPLLSAAFKNHKQIVQLLLSYGASLEQTEAINSITNGYKLSKKTLEELWVMNNLIKLIYARKLAFASNKGGMFTNAPEMIFDEILRINAETTEENEQKGNADQ